MSILEKLQAKASPPVPAPGTRPTGPAPLHPSESCIPVALTNGWLPVRSQGRLRKRLPRCKTLPPSTLEQWARDRLVPLEHNYCCIGETRRREQRQGPDRKIVIEPIYPRRTLLADYREYCRSRGLPELTPQTFAGHVATVCQRLGWAVFHAQTRQLRRSALVGVNIVGQEPFNGEDFDGEHHRPRWLRKPRPGETLDDVKQEHRERVRLRARARRAERRALKAKQAELDKAAMPRPSHDSSWDFLLDT